MSAFEFDRPSTVAPNGPVRHNGCETCDGHRMIMVAEHPEAWARCPTCNPPSALEEPARAARWWEE